MVSWGKVLSFSTYKVSLAAKILFPNSVPFCLKTRLRISQLLVQPSLNKSLSMQYAREPRCTELFKVNQYLSLQSVFSRKSLQLSFVCQNL